MTEAKLLITDEKVFLEADDKSKLFSIDSTFQKRLIQYLMKKNIRVVQSEKHT